MKNHYIASSKKFKMLKMKFAAFKDPLTFPLASPSISSIVSHFNTISVEVAFLPVIFFGGSSGAF